MIKVKQISENKNEKAEKALADFLNQIGEDKIVNIVASPDAIMARSPITPTTLYTVIYRD
ncbi:hypothetical protein [Clostridium sp. KNHs216]|uniref:hypothetical protein n=1 Tax=Clostridium sp. KNHs216 TaxID=1550235 RepID=UPI0011513F98|nr:hypothetical protein [Clostridium sp. KNHs216]TQI69008.1 hypothetical protein LY85_3757 [Clostridium sp. KNHs216]